MRPNPAARAAIEPGNPIQKLVQPDKKAIGAP